MKKQAKVMKKKVAVKKRSVVVPSRNRGYSRWAERFVRLCRLGGAPVQLDGLRAHMRVKHFQVMREFRGEKWVAWSTPALYVRAVPQSAEPLYREERAACESAGGAEMASRLMGNEPTETCLDSKGRLWIPHEIAQRAGIAEGSAVYVLFRDCAVEIWSANALTEAYSQSREAIRKMLHGRVDLVPVLPAKSKAVPGHPVHEEHDL
jgi:bifunctional DNA-binding transcriptional regulator/antitoxin component of YhaV-PrlF toxin-antitoxin module